MERGVQSRGSILEKCGKRDCRVQERQGVTKKREMLINRCGAMDGNIR